MRKILAYLSFFAGALGSLYVGIWLMFFKPIIDCYNAFFTGTLTWLMVGVCFIKCVLASVVGYFIFVIGAAISNFLFLSIEID